MTPQAVARAGLTARTVTLSYFATNVARQLGLTPPELRRHLGDGPFLASLSTTPLGVSAGITLPLTYAELVRDRRSARSYAQAALDMAFAMNASYVSLAGLLASALDYGSRLDAPPGRITTGHATTAAAILKTVQAVLGVANRRWAVESVGVLGVGSVGRAVIAAALAKLGRPRRIVLADLAVKEAEVTALGDFLAQDYPGLDVSFADATRLERNALYEASLIIGCTSTPNVLRVEKLAPGCIVVDDSVPHCFDVARARARVAEAGDILLANGGGLAFAESYPTTSYPPELLRRQLGWRAGTHRGSYITSCVLSPLLMAADPNLPATVGQGAAVPAVLANWDALDQHAISAPPIHCAGTSPSSEDIARFAERFGNATAHHVS
jgi:hypothetical protein